MIHNDVPCAWTVVLIIYTLCLHCSDICL